MCETSHASDATASRICAAAIDNCMAATIPTSDQSPICSSRSRGGAPAVKRKGRHSAFCRLLLPLQKLLGSSDHHRRRNCGQTAKVARHAVTLVAGPAGERPGVDADRADRRIAPRHRSLGQRRAEQRDDRRARRRRDVQRAAVAADVERRAIDQRARAPPGRTRRCGRYATPRRRQGDAPRSATASAAALSDGPGRDDDAPRRIRGRERRGRRRERGGRPAPKRIAGADVQHDQPRRADRRPLRRSRSSTRRTASGSSGIVTASRARSGGSMPSGSSSAH